MELNKFHYLKSLIVLLGGCTFMSYTQLKVTEGISRQEVFSDLPLSD